MGWTICPDKHDGFLKIETVKGLLAQKVNNLCYNTGMFYTTY